MRKSAGDINFFSQNDKDDSLIRIKQNILDSLSAHPSSFNHDQYKNYFYSPSNSHEAYFIRRIRQLFDSQKGDWTFFYRYEKEQVLLLGARISKWDEDHFGFGMATLQFFSIPSFTSVVDIKGLIGEALIYLKKKQVRYITCRVNGDLISALHACEDAGFRYYDNVIWPIARSVPVPISPEVRLMKAQELDRVKEIATNFQYQRGHYYCDSGFDKEAINSMYSKWVETAINNKESIAVIERESRIAGFFIFKTDDELSAQTGFRYGRLKLLTLDSKYRGSGAGRELFTGALGLLNSSGVDYVDSGYSTKNHVSARLHAQNGFYSVYEEVTFHLWLNNFQ